MYFTKCLGKEDGLCITVWHREKDTDVTLGNISFDYLFINLLMAISCEVCANQVFVSQPSSGPPFLASALVHVLNYSNTRQACEDLGPQRLPRVRTPRQ